MASQASTPLWIEVPQAISYVITAAGLIVTGIWAYVRFVRGRVLHPMCQLGLSAKKLDMLDGTAALKVTATISNSGGLRLLFPLSSHQTIRVYRADSVIWNDAFHYGEVLWTEGKFYECDMLTIEGVKRVNRTLDPGGRLRRFLLVPVTDDPCAAYLISMSIIQNPM